MVHEPGALLQQLLLVDDTLRRTTTSVAATRTSLAAAATHTTTHAPFLSAPSVHTANRTRLVHVQWQRALWLGFGHSRVSIPR